MFGVVFGAFADYSEDNGLVIYTPKYLYETYNEKAVDNGYNSINIEESNYKTIGYELLLVNKNNRYGITDLDFKEIVGTKYDTIQFNEYSKKFIISNAGKYGIINENGNIKINLIYDEISIINYSPLLYKVQLENKYGILNEEGRIIANTEYEEIGYEGPKENSLEKAVVVIPKLTDDINKSIIVKRDSGYGLIDVETGEKIIECDLEKIYGILEDGKLIYEAVFKGQKVDLIQYIRAVNSIVVNM